MAVSAAVRSPAAAARAGHRRRGAGRQRRGAHRRAGGRRRRRGGGAGARRRRRAPRAPPLSRLTDGAGRYPRGRARLATDDASSLGVVRDRGRPRAGAWLLGGRAAGRAPAELVAAVPRWQVMDEGDAAAHHFLAQALADGPARRRHPVRGGARQPEPPRQQPGLDRRSARRHQRVRRGRARRVGGARRARRRRHARSPPPSPCPRSARRSPPSPPPALPPRRDGPAAGRSPAAGTRPYAAVGRSARRSAPSSCASAVPAPRRWRSCSATPTSTPTPAACTSGTRPRPSAVAAAAGLPRQPPRRLAARLQPARPVAPRPARSAGPSWPARRWTPSGADAWS